METSNTKNSALMAKKAPTMPKPQWHPPWKLYRVSGSVFPSARSGGESFSVDCAGVSGYGGRQHTCGEQVTEFLLWP